jgi:hypothetical protein
MRGLAGLANLEFRMTKIFLIPPINNFLKDLRACNSSCRPLLIRIYRIKGLAGYLL